MELYIDTGIQFVETLSVLTYIKSIFSSSPNNGLLYAIALMLRARPISTPRLRAAVAKLVTTPCGRSTRHVITRTLNLLNRFPALRAWLC
jgi:hypothetical protein